MLMEVVLSAAAMLMEVLLAILFQWCMVRIVLRPRVVFSPSDGDVSHGGTAGCGIGKADGVGQAGGVGTIANGGSAKVVYF
ncbi:hypothetical protein RchiOBHm_Chr1g0353441 [Rosa chinensis]|uniref:Uncharacterized protein n=1 Tax=Rosa chinensis TaxID=74649 RepID=A0A2P6SGU3_ROSCH|nr:hypothetical protein RchiOBHm_Chr1g0353441 [Rosa chinensis]